MHTGLPFWVGFNAAVLALLAFDLFLFNRSERIASTREAILWSLFWVALSLGFAGYIFYIEGGGKVTEFLTGYVIEYSLSVDNLFLFVLIFGYFKIPLRNQHGVLLWGILGALVMRGTMILMGVHLIQRFHWIFYLFGAFLLFTGVRMAMKPEESSPDGNPVVRLCRRVLPMTPELKGDCFAVRRGGRWLLTPLALALVVIELMDLLFAVDSIPATFAVTTDPFIVYTSNICAILGLRSLYFVLARMAHCFKYLRYGLAFILCFIGVKMLVAGVFHISSLVSLAVVALVLAISVAASLLL